MISNCEPARAGQSRFPGPGPVLVALLLALFIGLLIHGWPPAHGAAGGIVSGTPQRVVGGTNLTLISVTNLTVFNTLISSNFITTNLTVNNDIVVNAGGRLFVSNIFTTNLYVSNIIAQTILVSNENVFPMRPGTNILFVTNGGIVTVHGTATGGGLSGTTNFLSLSVQAAKMPATNYPYVDAGWQAWEAVYAETNAENIRTNLSASWQFVVPPDYATNSLSVSLLYSLVNTNGPNSSNVIFGVSALRITSGTTNNVHTNLFGSMAFGTNVWQAKYDGTNILTNLVINLDTNCLLMPADLAVLKIERRAFNDEYGGAVALHGIQLKYTRP